MAYLTLMAQMPGLETEKERQRVSREQWMLENPQQRTLLQFAS